MNFWIWIEMMIFWLWTIAFTIGVFSKLDRIEDKLDSLKQLLLMSSQEHFSKLNQIESKLYSKK